MTTKCIKRRTEGSIHNLLSCHGAKQKEKLTYKALSMSEHNEKWGDIWTSFLPSSASRQSGITNTGSGSLIRGHSAGSYAGMVWETILAEFPDIEGKTVLAAIALPPSLLTTHRLSHHRKVHLIHHADDRLCVWNPSKTSDGSNNRGSQSHTSQDGEYT